MEAIKNTESFFGWNVGYNGSATIRSLVTGSINAMRRKRTKKSIDTMDVCEQCGRIVFKEYLSVHNNKTVCGSCRRSGLH